MPAEGNGVRWTADPLWSMELAVNGEPAESDLTTVDSGTLSALAQHVAISVTGSGDEVSLVDTHTVAHGIWWWLTLVVLGLLLAETLTLATAHRQSRLFRKPEWAT